MKWINLNAYNGLLTGATLSIGYLYGGRISKYSPKSRHEWGKVIRRNDLMFFGAPLDPSALIIDFRNHKTNKCLNQVNYTLLRDDHVKITSNYTLTIRFSLHFFGENIL